MRTACFALLIAALFVASPFPRARASEKDAEPQPPARPVQELNRTLLRAMQQAKELGFPGRYELLKPVIEERFALRFMVGRSLGRYWKDLPEGQRLRLLELYTRWSAAAYAGRFDSYAGQTFRIDTIEDKGRWTTVTSTMCKPDGKEIVFRYDLHPFDGAWKILDIKVSGISQLASTRAQMTSIMDKEGFDGLVRTLQDKIAELSEGGGDSSAFVPD
jgi:phospholipid transport system substrate-binding protein